MPTDNVISNPGSGGATFRSLADSGSVEHPAFVVEYATTVSGGANVLQPVTPSFGLPVVNVGALPAGTNSIGTVVLGAGSASVGNVNAVQSGSWTVTANAGTGTFAISAASLPLPTGAATSAKQAALGTAGTPSADVISVQGVASMTALKVDGSGVTQPVSGTFWQTTQPVSGTVTANAGTGTFAENVTQFGGTNISTGVGAGGLGIPRVTLSSDSELQIWDGVSKVGVTTATSVNGLVVQDQPATSGGLSPYHLISTASTNATNVKNAAGQLYEILVINTTTTICYLKLYDKASAPSPASDTPKWTIPVPPAAASGQAGGVAKAITKGLAFSTGISFALVGGIADNDNTNGQASVAINLGYV